jgi:T5SS/PEP-CTERM-associated repeat protein
MSILLSALLAMGTSGPASANLVHWTNPAGGDFSTASNWNPNQVPGPGDEPVFGLDEIFSVGFDRNYTTDFLRMRKGDVTFDLGGFTYTSQLFVGDQPGSNPMLRITNGRLATSYGRIGMVRGATGAVSVAGSGSVWDVPFLVVGTESDSSGAVLVTDGAQLNSGSALLSSNPGSTALVTVTGAGSTWTSQAPPTLVSP